jgi:hypothetical protein
MVQQLLQLLAASQLQSAYAGAVPDPVSVAQSYEAAAFPELLLCQCAVRETPT